MSLWLIRPGSRTVRRHGVPVCAAGVAPARSPNSR